ncbi:MAG: type B 50S ribosomal protein L31 [Candidatus Dadabacteria bacterium]|nr:type B 50S ribosomal protein L31 [Candidatus Dadabacteria bacterium]NIQ15776.1 type B 50S ribosomal protein L31 [Candidatus Dadabacteria bacterium]
MKKGIHPDYNYVVFKDASTGFSFLTRSTKSSEEKVTWEDGNEYPLITVEISSDSHPYYTGKEKQFEKEGRVEKFRRKYEKKSKKDKAEEK